MDHGHGQVSFAKAGSAKAALRTKELDRGALVQPSLDRKMNYAFHVMRLREQIKCGERVKSVAAANKLFQIACERRRIAGDIADSLRP